MALIELWGQTQSSDRLAQVTIKGQSQSGSNLNKESFIKSNWQKTGETKYDIFLAIDQFSVLLCYLIDLFVNSPVHPVNYNL